jgi:hypothetical protein
MAAGSVTARLIDAVIAAGTAPLLKAAGFRKAGRAFQRAAGCLFQVVQFQASQWNTPDHAQFTANLNIVQPFFHEVWSGRPFPSNPASAAAIVSQRIGLLMPGGRDHWWEVTPATEVGPLGAKVASAVADYGLTFLADYADLERLITELETVPAAWTGLHPGVCRAILLASCGDREAARGVLRRVNESNKVPAFAETIHLVADRLGIEAPPNPNAHRTAAAGSNSVS